MLDLAVAKLEPAQALDQAEIELERAVGLWRLAGDRDLAGLPAAVIEHERGRQFEPRHDKIGIDAALESKRASDWMLSRRPVRAVRLGSK